MTPRALILVDIQNDFLPSGALAVHRGDEVVAVANRLMAKGGFDLVLATQDYHPADHGSFASQHPGGKVGQVIQLNGLNQILWPDHCIQATGGADFAPGLERQRIQAIFQKGMDIGVDSYSGFFDNGRRKATGLEAHLRSRSVGEISIVGLATDYCVKYTALDAASLGFKTHLILEGVRGVELHAGDCKRAIGEMQSAGVEVE